MLCFMSNISVIAEENPPADVQAAPPIETAGKAAILMDIKTGKTLFEKNSHERLAPASITKVMTLLLVMEAVESGRIGIEDEVVTSDHAASMGGSQIWLEKGEIMTVNDMVKATCVASANDAAVALGEHLAGTEPAFVEMMNKRAEQLGMADTTFRNACGLDEEGHMTSAHDIALMSRELIQHELIKTYSKIWMDSLRNGETQLVNTNRLVRFYEGITGLKTGTTDAAGVCVSATAERGGLGLVAVVLGCSTGDERNETARAMLDYGFANYASVKMDTKGLNITDIKVLHGVKSRAAVAADGDCYVLMPKGREKEILQTVTLSDDVLAPVEKSQILGKVTVTLGSEVLGEYMIRAGESIAKMTVGKALGVLFKELLRV